MQKTDNKSVTSWLGLRNDAAHPDSKEIDGETVKLMIEGIKLFIKKYPAWINWKGIVCKNELKIDESKDFTTIKIFKILCWIIHIIGSDYSIKIP